MLEITNILGLFIIRMLNNYYTRKGSRAIFPLLRKARSLFLPYDIFLKLYKHIVVRIITYGCEIWGRKNIDIIDKLQLRFLKYI